MTKRDDPESLVQVLEATGQYRVLRRLEPRARWHEDDGAERRTAVVVDVETTGLNADRDVVIQFCGIPFSYDPATGRIFEVGPALTGYDDPGRPIPAVVTRLTGITDADVAGKRLDEAAIASLLEPAVLVIAHNAAFDRPFLDARLPAAFKNKHWACSVDGIPWDRYGFHSRRLEYLLFQRHRLFFDAHSALADCQALVHALAEPFDDGVLPMGILLEGARRKLIRIWAVGSPFEQKDILKARGYRFQRSGSGPANTWYREMTEGPESEAECDWLRGTIYGGREGWKVERLDPRTRYARQG